MLFETYIKLNFFPSFDIQYNYKRLCHGKKYWCIKIRNKTGISSYSKVKNRNDGTHS